jgi:plastocyanin
MRIHLNSKRAAATTLTLLVLLVLVYVAMFAKKPKPQEDLVPVSQTHALLIKEQCAMEPLELSLKAGEPLLISNNDTATHTIAFEGKDPFIVPPAFFFNMDTEAMFGNQTGSWSYSCVEAPLSGSVGKLTIVMPQ